MPITGVSGTLSHGSQIVISGSGFGTKATAAPYIWDDCSGTDPSAKWDLVLPGSNGSTYRTNYRTPAQVTRPSGGTGVALPHARATKYLCGCHYNGGFPTGYDAGWNVCVGKQGAQAYEYTYISHWQRVDPNWDDDTGNDRNYKEYAWVADSSYLGYKQLYFDNKDGPAAASVTWNANYLEMGNYTIYSVNPALVDWYPETGTVWGKIQVGGPSIAWRKIEYVLRHNHASGFHQIFHNNQKVWEVFLDDDNVSEVVNRLETCCGGYARDDFSANNWRYWNDIYVDHTLARVMIGNASTYTACTQVEPQIPSAWADGSITVAVNQAAISSLPSAYIYVFTHAGALVDANGFPLSALGEPEPPALQRLILPVRRR